MSKSISICMLASRFGLQARRTTTSGTVRVLRRLNANSLGPKLTTFTDGCTPATRPKYDDTFFDTARTRCELVLYEGHVRADLTSRRDS